MGETLHLLFRRRENGAFELQVRENWSGRAVSGSFVPPYTGRQLNALHKKLNKFNNSIPDLRDIGYRLFLALCGSETPGTSRRELSEQSVQAMLRSVIQRTLRRRGTVALTFSFAPDCDEFARYPWELLHNGEHFLLASGVFSLTRALLRPGEPLGCDLPAQPPMRMLYNSATPRNCTPLETERSYEAMRRALAGPIEKGQLWLDRLDQVTFDDLVTYLSSHGGAGLLDDNETVLPCYAIHFDGHGAFGRLCPDEDCQKLNDAEESKCVDCQTPLSRVRPQTYLSFCNEEGGNSYIDTQSLRELFISSDVRLVVLSACETAAMPGESSRHQHRSVSFDATLATSLVMAQVPAVVAMPFSIQDDLSPTFMYHFYDAIAHGRTLEEALARARQALLPIKQHSWFVPVLYRHVVEGEEGPVALLVGRDEPQEHDHPLSHLGATSTFIGREREIEELTTLIEEAVGGESRRRSRIHHFALTGPAGIGKSELAFEVAHRNLEKFPGGIIGISLQGGKSLGEALLEITHALHIHSKSMNPSDTGHCERTVLNAFRGLANRDHACLLLLDGFEEIQEHTEVGSWYRFLCSLPEQVVVLLTSRSNPSSVAALEGAPCSWYEYPDWTLACKVILKH